MKDFKEDYIHPYLSQIDTQCDYAIESMKKLNSLFDNPNADNFVSSSEVYLFVTSFITAVANIDKIFNNPNLKKVNFITERKTFLQSKFDQLHLELPSRKIRNSIEHFDERIDSHVTNSSIFIDHNLDIVPKYSLHTNAFQTNENKIFRHLIYVTSTKEFYLRMLGKEMNLTNVELTIRKIKVKCNELRFGHLY